MWFIIIATVIVGALLYKYFSSTNDVWKKHGIREIDTSPAVGTLDFILRRKSMGAADEYAYRLMSESNDKFCGFIEMGMPTLLVKDLELVKKVMIKDFDHFVDRQQIFTKQDGILLQMLPSLEGEEWKGVRASVSPTFTTGKIRRMMDVFNQVGKEWVDDLTSKAMSHPSGSVTIDVQQAAGQYTVEVISSAVFGMHAGVLKNPDSLFAKHAQKLSSMGPIQVLRFLMRVVFPRLSRLLGITLVDMKAISFFEGILKQGLKSRMDGDSKRNDLLQLLVEAKRGELRAAGSDELDTFEKDAQIEGVLKKQYLTDEVMSAQCVVFFFAGFSTTSNFITFALYALALHQDVQKKLRTEVNKIVKEDGTFDYNEVNQSVFMDMVLCEVLRKFPANDRLTRVCTKEYRDPAIGLVIPKGANVGIPVTAIHHDKEFYENPEKFDPEHFAPDKKAARNPMSFIPFGSGPRNCIGMRFALTEIKSVIAHLVHRFIIEPTPKTPVPFQGKPVGIAMVPPGNLQLKLTPIRKEECDN